MEKNFVQYQTIIFPSRENLTVDDKEYGNDVVDLTDTMHTLRIYRKSMHNEFVAH